MSQQQLHGRGARVGTDKCTCVAHVCTCGNRGQPSVLFLGAGHLIYIETVDLELAGLARLFRPGSPGNLLVSTPATLVL